ncbi:MAG TPA: endonuclease III domain-containing protein [Planctomycetota bacterium]|nr:endonuclease III domain-containing protein [Planctomycetota bacterium]
MTPPFVGVPPPRRRPRASGDPRLEAIWRALHERYGPRFWWPAATPFEVLVGAILTQNTAWKNVEHALRNLRRADALSPGAILGMKNGRLERLLHPSGYFRLKAQRLRSAVRWLAERGGGKVERLRRLPLERARADLLSVRGVGPETADSILNYAAGRRTFVADLYSRRVVVRHGLLPPGTGYEGTRRFFVERLRRSLYVTQEFHALLVAVGNRHCRARPRCEGCPLRPLLPPGGPLPD